MATQPNGLVTDWGENTRTSPATALVYWRWGRFCKSTAMNNNNNNNKCDKWTKLAPRFNQDCLRARASLPVTWASVTSRRRQPACPKILKCLTCGNKHEEEWEPARRVTAGAKKKDGRRLRWVKGSELYPARTHSRTQQLIPGQCPCSAKS